MMAPVAAPAAHTTVEAWGRPVYKKKWLFGKWKYSGMSDVKYVPRTHADLVPTVAPVAAPPEVHHVAAPVCAPAPTACYGAPAVEACYGGGYGGGYDAEACYGGGYGAAEACYGGDVGYGGYGGACY